MRRLNANADMTLIKGKDTDVPGKSSRLTGECKVPLYTELKDI